jgi:hypothetical protein
MSTVIEPPPPAPDKVLIGKALKDGFDVPGARLVTGNRLEVMFPKAPQHRSEAWRRAVAALPCAVYMRAKASRGLR